MPMPTEHDDLYRIARKVTDAVCGKGTYAALHLNNPDPQIRAEAHAAMREEANESRARFLDALFDISFRYRPVTLSVRGTHGEWTCVAAGEFEFNIDADGQVERIVAWAEALRKDSTARPPDPRPWMDSQE